MIKDILRYLYIENLSIAETAEELDVSIEKLKEIIGTMEHMGYVKTRHDQEEHACSGCKSCAGMSTCRTEHTYMPGKRIILTEKGQRLCNKL